MTDVLHPERHKRLIADLPAICEVANVPMHMVRCSARPYLSPAQLEWLVNYPTMVEQGTGLLITGKQAHPPETICMAICAALMRNFIDARFISLGTLLADDAPVPDPTVMVVPNLYVVTAGKALPDWKVQHAYDVLVRRRATGRLSVVYVEDMKALEAAYGAVFRGHFSTGYMTT